MNRPTFNETFFNTAKEWSKRSTCLRRQVGAVAVKEKRVLCTGYNGAIAGSEHCKTCYRQDNNIPSGKDQQSCRALHAEQNLIIQAAIHGVNIYKCDVYVTHKPCIICFKMLAQLQCPNIYYLEDYPDEMTDKEIKLNNYVINKIDGKYNIITKIF